MRIAILGGSFDPPHVGHQLIARQVKETIGVDDIWLMPADNHPFAKSLLPVQHRLQMARFLENEYIRVSDFEIKYNKSSYTIDTLEKLDQDYPQDIFYWILGSDQLDSFTKYKGWEQLRDDHNLIVFPRETVIDHLEEKTKKCLQLDSIPDNITLLRDKDLILTNISSSLVRERIKRDESLEYIVPKQVEEYIKQHSLYT